MLTSPTEQASVYVLEGRRRSQRWPAGKGISTLVRFGGEVLHVDRRLSQCWDVGIRNARSRSLDRRAVATAPTTVRHRPSSVEVEAADRLPKRIWRSARHGLRVYLADDCTGRLAAAASRSSKMRPRSSVMFHRFEVAKRCDGLPSSPLHCDSSRRACQPVLRATPRSPCRTRRARMGAGRPHPRCGPAATARDSRSGGRSVRAS